MKFRMLAAAIAIAIVLVPIGVIPALGAQDPAQSYPVRPVRLIVPFAAGSAADIQARVLARELQDRLGQGFVVENRAGASGVLGTQLVTAAAPDGYTLLFTSAALATCPSLYGSRLKFDPLQSLAPISWVTNTPLVLIVHPNVQAKSALALIDISRKRPTLLNAAINFTGSTSHLSAELLKQRAGLKFATVAYKNSGFSMIAVMGGEVDFQFAEGVHAARQISTGKIRALAVTTAKPSEFFPGLPTMSSVLPGFVADDWFAMFFPAGVRAEIVAAVNGALRNALESKFVRAFLAGEALTAVGGSPEALEEHLKREIAHYREVVRKGNVTMQ